MKENKYDYLIAKDKSYDILENEKINKLNHFFLYGTLVMMIATVFVMVFL